MKISIDGKRSNYLFSAKQNYIGKIYIECYERTCREDMQAKVRWQKGSDTQTIVYFQNGSFPSLQLDSRILINDMMTKFAFGFKDGTVIATSDEMYKSYIVALQPRK